MTLNRKGLALAASVATICAASLVTLLNWPPTDGTTWEPLAAPAWWQFEWLAGLGFWLSALPSGVIYKFGAFFAANEHLRYPASGLLLIIEVGLICFGVYKIVAALDRKTVATEAHEASH